MIDVDAWLTETALDAKMIMQVHDELVFEVADEACETLCNNVTERMANVIEIQVPYSLRWVWVRTGMRRTRP